MHQERNFNSQILYTKDSDQSKPIHTCLIQIGEIPQQFLLSYCVSGMHRWILWYITAPIVYNRIIYEERILGCQILDPMDSEYRVNLLTFVWYQCEIHDIFGYIIVHQGCIEQQLGTLQDRKCTIHLSVRKESLSVKFWTIWILTRVNLSTLVWYTLEKSQIFAILLCFRHT